MSGAGPQGALNVMLVGPDSIPPTAGSLKLSEPETGKIWSVFQKDDSGGQREGGGEEPEDKALSQERSQKRWHIGTNLVFLKGLNVAGIISHLPLLGHPNHPETGIIIIPISLMGKLLRGH